MAGTLSDTQRKIYQAVVLIWLVLFVTVMSTIVMLDLQRAKALFIENANMHYQQASNRMHTTESILEGFAAMVSVSDDRDWSRIRSYARKMLEQYPHIFRFQIVAKVPHHQIESFVAYNRQNLDPDFSVKSFSYETDRRWQPIQQSRYHMPIVFMEPFPERSPQLLGIDLSANAFLSSALQDSETLNHAVSSDPFNLVSGDLAYIIHRPIPPVDRQSPRYPAPGGAVAEFAVLVILADTLLDREYHPLRGMRELLYKKPFNEYDPRGYLHLHEEPPTSWLESKLFPCLRLSMNLASSSQPLVLLVEHQLGWGIISWGKLVLTLLIGVLTFGVMMLYARLYLRHAMARAERYLQIARAIIVGLDRDGRVTLVNRRGCEILGYSEKEIVGLNWFDSVLPPDRRDAARQRFRRIIAGELKPRHQYESEILTSKGETRHIDWNSAIETAPSGEIVGLLSSGQDITARKRAEDDALRHQQDLAHVMRLSTMGEMASGMAHELNQPLTALVSYCGSATALLKSLPSPPPQLGDVVNRAAEQAHRAAAIIRHLRASVRKEVPHRETFDLNQAIRDVVVLLKWDVQRSGATVVLELGNQPYRVSANRIQIEQVLLNLVRNSLEAIEHAKIPDGHIRIRTRALDDNRIETTVSDNGPGIDATLRDRIFDQFQTSKPSGMGIGLSISRTIIGAHGGRLWADRHRPDGALFGFDLPAGE